MISRSWALAALMTLCLCAPAWAAPVTVQLRVEGASTTLFEGPVTTDAKTIQKESTGPHPCDGTNDGANPTPGPTMTTALEDGQGPGAYTWAGAWAPTLSDFSVDRIGPDANDNAANKYWGYALNFVAAVAGGCHVQVKAGDEVLFGYDFFSKAHVLRLTGPSTAVVGEPTTVRVVDGGDGSPIAGASVGGATTGLDGTAGVTFSSPGVQRLKAERADSVRSNALSIAVGAAAIATAQAAPTRVADRIPPRVLLTSLRANRRYRRGPRLLAGSVADDGGIHQSYFRLRRTARGGCSWYSAKRERFSRPGSCRRSRFNRLGDGRAFSYLLPERLPRGRYVLELKALDRALNVGSSRVRFRVG